jgi:hypothetical protein
MHKKKNKEKVLAGELILTFLKDGAQRARSSERFSPMTIEQLLDETLVEVSPDGRPFAGELLFNQVVLEAWKRGALRCLDVSREDFTEILTKRGWRYNAFRHQWFNAPETAPGGSQLTF